MWIIHGAKPKMVCLNRLGVVGSRCFDPSHASWVSGMPWECPALSERAARSSKQQWPSPLATLPGTRGPWTEFMRSR